jgi:tRNA(His) 5'-end guanylyltransferase
MKANYESCFRIYLPKRMPVIIRLDGKAFHSLTKDMNKPFDNEFIKNMALTAQKLLKEVQNGVFAYVQSDEISLLLHNYKRLNTESWFGNNVQKMVSISAGIASSYFTYLLNGIIAVFDARAFVIPEVLEIASKGLLSQCFHINNCIIKIAMNFKK